jgi:hypothetical protein
VLVYGDHEEIVDPANWLERLKESLCEVDRLPPGLDRHGRLVGALIDAGRLLQGLADARAPTEDHSRFLRQLADSVVRSWDTDFREIGRLPIVPSIDLLPTIALRLPEGFAFYAVYPEAYVEAARKLVLCGPPRVIGIRSIGTTLGAVVAAALGAPAPLTVRPFGDPFARQVELPPDAIEPHAHYVIVDEGPGLSGSSFGAVADWLEQRGVPLERIAFLPSHGGELGPQASVAHRKRWDRAQRVAAKFDLHFLETRFGLLEEFSTDHPWERRKFLGWYGRGRVLLKFAGLGTIGERKLEMARALHASGLTPGPLCLAHGFLIERWCEDALPLGRDEKPIEEIGRYIGARARLFPAEHAGGASIEELLSMSRHNIALALGPDAARMLDQFDADLLAPRVHRVRTDNKLDRHEWLRLRDGRVLKTDAVDHHQAHDLIGCQDVAWDIACAIVEFGLDPCEADRLVAASGLSIDPELLAFSQVAYCAFRLGHARLAAQSAPANVTLRGDAERYATELRKLLHQYDRAGIPQESSVD